MKTKKNYRRFRGAAPVEQTSAFATTPDTSSNLLTSRKKRITAISEDVIEYYQNLLKEHNRFAAMHSRAEYRIL